MKCKHCVYEPKCGSKPIEEAGCVDFKDRELFVEMPFMANQLLYYIEPATKYVPVVIDGAAYFKLVDDSEIKTHMFDCGELEHYLHSGIHGFMRERTKYYTTRDEAEKALEEVRSHGRTPDVCEDDSVI